MRSWWKRLVAAIEGPPRVDRLPEIMARHRRQDAERARQSRLDATFNALLPGALASGEFDTAQAAIRRAWELARMAEDARAHPGGTKVAGDA